MEEVHLLDDDSSPGSKRTRSMYHYHKFDPLLEFNDKEFRSKLRMTKQSIRRLDQVLAPLLPDADDGRGNPCPSAMKLMIALRFYATGSFHYFNGEVIGFSASHVCNSVRDVSAALASLLPAYFKFPDQRQRQQVRFAGGMQTSHNVPRT